MGMSRHRAFNTLLVMSLGAPGGPHLSPSGRTLSAELQDRALGFVQKECLPSLALLYVCLPVCSSVCPLKTDTVPVLPPSCIPFCSPTPTCRETGFLHSLSFPRHPSLLFPGSFSHWDDSQPSGATADNQPSLPNDPVSEPQASWL